MIEKELEQELKLHLQELKKIGISYGHFTEDQEPTTEELVSFALMFRILELDNFLSSGNIPGVHHLRSLRVYSELLKVFKNDHGPIKNEGKPEDPLEKLRQSIKKNPPMLVD